ncbi:MAG: S8 family serine peptidase, partial [Candidatus Binatia bacterium]
MRQRTFFALTAFMLSATMALPTVAMGQTRLQRGDHVAGELLIVPQEGVSEQEVLDLYRRHGGKTRKKLSRIKTHRVELAPQSVDTVETALKKHPKIKYVERNYWAETMVIPNDPGFSHQWHLQKISAPAGWEITIGSPAVTVAIVDSGIDSNHPDLQSKIVAGHNFVENNADTDDVDGHGTAVAGAAAALTNSGIGVAGVAWANTVMPLLVVDASGYATYGDVAEAIIYAADHGAKVINLSLGGPSYSNTLQNAINYAWNKGVVIVASAGNESSNAPLYPAALSNVIAVSASDQSDRPASFSNFGSWVDVAAPGTSIYTTNNGGSYGSWHGTSFSSPLVAGLAALIFSLNPNLTSAQVVDILRGSADDLGAGGFDPAFGYGRINVARALEVAATVATIDVAITSPGPNSAVSGVIPVEVSAHAHSGISRVEYYVDGVLNETDTSAPYAFLWNSSGVTGAHTLVAKAYDANGAEKTSAPVSVTVLPVDQPPHVQIT